MVLHARLQTGDQLARFGEQVQFLAPRIFVNKVALRLQTALESPDDDLHGGRVSSDVFRQFDREVALQTFWPRANADELEVIKDVDHIAEVVLVDFLGFVIDPVQFPRIGKLLAGEDSEDVFIDLAALDFLLPGFELHQVVAVHLQEIVFDPVPEFRGQVNAERRDKRLHFAGFADVVLVRFVRHAVADDQIGDGNLAFFVERDSLAPSFERVIFLVERVDDAEPLVVGGNTADQSTAFDADQRLGGLLEPIGSVRRIIVVRRNDPELSFLLHRKDAGSAEFFVDPDDPQRGGLVIVLQFGEELAADGRGPVRVFRSAEDAGSNGRAHHDQGGGDEFDGLDAVVHSEVSPVLERSGKLEETLTEKPARAVCSRPAFGEL